MAACASHETRVREPVTLPEATYAAVRQRESIQTLRARFSLEMRGGNEERRADGVLLVKKPDRFRLRLLSAFGFTVFDYTSVGTHARMELPLEGKRFVDGEIPAHAAFSPADMRTAFLGAGMVSDRCVPAVARAQDAVLLCFGKDEVVTRRLVVDSATATIRQETDFAGGLPYLVMEFDDYRPVGRAVLPFAIDLHYPERNLRLKISVRRYEVNPVLPDGLFNSEPNAGQG